MALQTSYLTTAKNLEGIFAAIQCAQAQEKFTQAFLETRGMYGSHELRALPKFVQFGMNR